MGADEIAVFLAIGGGGGGGGAPPGMADEDMKMYYRIALAQYLQDRDLHG